MVFYNNGRANKGLCQGAVVYHAQTDSWWHWIEFTSWAFTSVLYQWPVSVLMVICRGYGVKGALPC